MLSNLGVGNDDPSQAEFLKAVTPKFHNIVRNFVNFDNFYYVSNVSFDGISYNSEGDISNINVGIANLQARIAAQPPQNKNPDLLPGNGNAGAPDAEDADGVD